MGSILGDDEKAVAQEIVTIEPKEKEEDSEQTQLESSEDDSSSPEAVVIKDGVQLVKWTDKDGVEHEKPWNEVIGSTFFKDKYDKWLTNEKKPLEQKASEFDGINQQFASDPETFLLENAEFAIVNGNMRWEHFLESTVQKAQAAGYNVALVDKDTGEPYAASTPRPPRPSRTERELAEKDKSSSQHLFEVELRAFKAEAGTGDVAQEVVARAEEEYRADPEFFKKRDPENPFRYALKLAKIDANAEQPPASKQMRRRSPAAPKEGQSFFKDPLSQKLEKSGVLKVG